MKRYILSAAAASLAAFMLFGCVRIMDAPPGNATSAADKSAAVSSDGGAEKNTLFGEFTATDINGGEVTSDIFADAKVSMVNVWATYCGPCIDEMPDLAKLSADYAGKGFQVIGIPADVIGAGYSPVDKTVSLAKDIISQTGASYLHIIPNETIYKNGLADIYAVPTTYFVDSDGNRIGESYIGSRSYDEWAEIIDGVLADIEK